MVGAASPMTLPNPYTPLAWLAPDTAREFEISRYLYIATITTYTLDWISSMKEEYRMLFKPKFRLIHIAYVGSRVASFGYITISLLFRTVPIPDCQALQYSVATCFSVALPCTSALFYIRVCAVFHWKRAIAVVFGMLWISVLLSAFTIIPAITGAHIGPTQYCINTEVATYSSASIIANTINDTLVFLAISWGLTYYSMSGVTWRGKMRSFTRGDGLPAFSRMLLHDGQLYYSATVALNIISMVLLLAPGLSPFLRATTTIPNVALENAMATRVFRAVHAGDIAESSRLPRSTVVFRSDTSDVLSGGTQTYRFSAPSGVYGSQGFTSDQTTASTAIETTTDLDKVYQGMDDGVSREQVQI